MNAPQEIQLSRNVARLGRLDLPGAGQVRLVGTMAYIGHIPNRERLGTSIVDVSDPRDPKVISQVFLDDDESHSHKARVVGDIMIVNHERNMTPIGRKADELPGARTALVASLGREPTHAELAAKIGVSEADIPVVEAAQKKGYHLGGFRVYDISDKSKPRQLVHHRTGGIGVHRFVRERLPELRARRAVVIVNVCGSDVAEYAKFCWALVSTKPCRIRS